MSGTIDRPGSLGELKSAKAVAFKTNNAGTVLYAVDQGGHVIAAVPVDKVNGATIDD